MTKIKAENLRLATRITKKAGRAGRREGEEIPERDIGDEVTCVMRSAPADEVEGCASVKNEDYINEIPERELGDEVTCVMKSAPADEVEGCAFG